MDWTKISITVAQSDIERATDIAHMVVPYGLYVEDYSDMEEVAENITRAQLIDEQLLQKDKNIAVIHVFISPEDSPAEAVAFLSERYKFSEIEHEIDTADVKEEDWAHSWKEYFNPLPVGEKLIICPTWREIPEDNHRTVLKIDPGMAFGTGGHETTKLVLELMEKNIKNDTSVLDVGCGSGILSIGAMLLGATQVTGVDIDRLAVKTAQKNGELNGMTPPRYNMMYGNLADDIDGRFDVVVANIVADAIIELSKDIPALLAHDGVYITSGIIDERESEVVTALEKLGFKLVETKRLRGWSALVFCMK